MIFLYQLNGSALKVIRYQYCQVSLVTAFCENMRTSNTEVLLVIYY